MAIAVEASAASDPGGANSSSVTLDTTDADFLIASVSVFGYIADKMPNALTDDEGNDWVYVPNSLQGSNSANVRLYVCRNPTNSSTLTVTWTANGSYATVCVLALSGVHIGSPYEHYPVGEEIATATSSSPGSLTPGEDSCISITGVCWDNSNTVTTPSGYSGAYDDYAGAVNMGGGLYYKIQTTAAAANPSWSWTSNTKGGSVHLVLRAASEHPAPSAQDSWVVPIQGLL